MAPVFEAQRTDHQGDLNDAHTSPNPDSLPSSNTSIIKQHKKLAPTTRTTSIPAADSVGRPQTPHRRRTAALPTRDASKPELYDRDSIWGTHYHEEPRPVASPVTSNANLSTSTISSSAPPDEGDNAMASVDIPTRAVIDSPSTTTSLFYDHPHIRNSSPLQFPRRSLYNLHDLSPLNNLLQTLHLQHQDSQRPDSPLASDKQPSTPIAAVQTHDYADDMEQSAERQKYRSWRQGQAKVNGLSIAESQRTQTRPDKVIDAALPQPEPAVANVRSRKASHYLGLFRENEAEEKRDTEQKKSGKAKGKAEQSESVTQVSKDVVAPAIEPQVREPTIVEDVEPEEAEEEDGNHVTVSKEHMSQVYPLDLLEEIRNNHHLEPGASSRKIPSTKNVTKTVPAKDDEGHVEEGAQKTSTKDTGSEDDESDREHISSAVYFPHQGVTVGDSPTEDQLTDRKPKDKPDSQPPQSKLCADDVQVSLHSDDARDYLHGVARATAATDFEPLPEPALPAEYRSDSEYESEYESATSGDGETDVETTPTATPIVKGLSQGHSPERRRSRQSPAPVGAVELKPYQHQVGGHTAMFSFSRRAVCKQLNSKENMFYETVEKHHPDLLTFMPRYIGVLNVTYRKEQKRRKTEGSKNREADSKQAASPSNKGDQLVLPDAARVISHSMQASSSSTIPQVIFANNRHLIPDNLFNNHRRSATPDIIRTRSSPPRPTAYSDDEALEDEARRPSLNTAASWGYTTRNQKLRDHILREVFSPPVIHKHDRRDRTYHGGRKFPKSRQAQLSQPHRHGSIDISTMRREEIMSNNDGTALAVPRRNSQRRTSNAIIERSASNIDQLMRESRATLSKSAETSEEPILGNRGHRRRHSGGGLTRKPTEIDGARGDLEFHEDEYTGDADADAEDDVFSMDDVKKECRKAQKQDDNVPVVTNGEEPTNGETAEGPPPRLGPAIDFGHPEPRNPETSLIQHDERVEHFLLLEDLTASMQRPCVLDLKMGTRQYGVEANAKKQASQRMKCKTTTSRELGVRVCGMQVYNVKTHSYSFKDKYNGRDLTAGSNFREALKGFFFDGIGYAQAIKHIPTILEKINALDCIIRQLPGYRLYASSLLMIYDRGDADENGKVRPAPPTEDGKPAQYPDIKLKIVDFANCVTAEDLDVVRHKPCPPRDMGSIDRGYIRGLRTLRLYFQQILGELCSQRHVERGEGEGMAVGVAEGIARKGWREGYEDDTGEVSV